MSSLCYDHSPRANKPGHLPFPETMLSLVCTVCRRAPGSPSYPFSSHPPRSVPSLSSPARMDIIKSETVFLEGL